jgi:serine/threonine-protein kinase
LWWIRGDGSGEPRKILDALNPRPTFFAADGRLVYSYAGEGGLPDIWTVPIDISDPERPKPGKAEPFLADPGIVEVDPALSPDGKFIAYASNESGPEEIYVRPFPGPGGKWKISTNGGKFPVFARSTRQLFFLGGDDRIWVADYTIQDGAFSASPARAWSPAKIFRDGVRQNFDISADGKRAVVFPAPVAEAQAGNLHATFLFNFFDEVRRRIP